MLLCMTALGLPSLSCSGGSATARHAGKKGFGSDVDWSLRNAGLVAEDLDPLQLSKDQRSALLNMLLQSKRMRLVMRDGQRTYTLPQ